MLYIYMTNITCSNGHILIHTVTCSQFFVCSNLFFLLIHFNHFIWKVLIRWQPRRRRKAKRSNHTVLQRESNSIKILIINIYIYAVMCSCDANVRSRLPYLDTGGSTVSWVTNNSATKWWYICVQSIFQEMFKLTIIFFQFWTMETGCG